MSFYFNGLQYVPGGDPGDILFIDPTQPGVVDTDTFFKYDPTTRRVRIWGGIGAGLDIGTGGMRIAYDGIAGLSVGTVGGTNYLQIGTAAPGDLDIRASFLNLGVSGASTNALLDIAGTWNTTGAANGIRLNVTDTASAAGSLVMDLRVGGVSQFQVSKTAGYAIESTYGLRRTSTTASVITGGNVGNQSIDLNGTFVLLNSIVFDRPNQDLILVRDAANTLAQRRGVNAQAFRIYNTFTDASNYERGVIAWSANFLTIGSQSAGTGASRDVGVISSGFLYFGSNNVYRFYVSNTAFLANGDNTYDIGLSNTQRPRNLFLGSYMQMSEMTAPAAPAANNVVIYAEDNGSGKTRLMARFATGAAQQIAIEP